MNVLELDRIDSEASLRSLIHDSLHLVIAIDPHGAVRVSSPSSLRTIGVEPREIEGRDILDFVHPEDGERLRAGLRNLVEGSTDRLRARFRARHSNGAWRLVALRGKLVPGPQGASLVAALLCEVRPPSAGGSETGATIETYRALVASSPLAIITLSVRGGVRTWNPAAERIFGWPAAEALHRPMSFLAADESGPESALLRRTLEGDHVSDHEMRQSRRDGTSVFVSVSTAPLREAGGVVTGVLWMARDISARRMGEETIAEQRRLLDSALDAILVRGTNERLLYCNQAALGMYGYTMSELRALDIRELIAAQDLPRFEEARRTLALRGSWEGELRQVTRDGRTLVVQSRWSLLRDKAGFPRARMVVNRDITAQKEMETHLRRTQRMESLGTLASGIAHDLNNILAPILMAVEVPKLHAADEHDRKLLGILESSAHRGGDIVHQMLAFARGSEGQRVPLQLRHVIREIETILRETFPRNIAISIDVPKDLPVVLADATQVHQVLINLCINARDALGDGGTIRVEASAQALDETRARQLAGASVGRYLVLAVADDGPGIPPAIKARIFEPFFTTKEKGTGLGLSTVLSIAHGHGGFVICHSEPGKGARFEVFFPAAVAPEAARADEPAPAIPLGAGETILVIDDDQSILLIVRQILESYDYRVLSAGDGASAVRTLREAPRGLVRLVLTDMVMPDLSGPSAVEALRRLEPDIPAILMSGLPPAAGSPEVDRLGVQGIVSKPFRSEELLVLIHEVLDATRPPSPV